MKAPDKIYFDGTSSACKQPLFSSLNIEYIRKDSLLKWAKDELKLSKDVECVSEKSYEEGRQQVALNLIDKLESM